MLQRCPGLQPNKCHIVVILVDYFCKKENCDLKIIIPTNRVNYNNHIVCQNSHTTIFSIISCSLTFHHCCKEAHSVLKNVYLSN